VAERHRSDSTPTPSSRDPTEIPREMSSLATEANGSADNRTVVVNFTALPDELFIAIFGHLVEDDIERARGDPLYLKSTISLTLSWVCRRWRSLAHATPSLWRYIPLALPRPTTTPAPIATIDHYLSHVSESQTLVLHWPRGSLLYPVQTPYDTSSESMDPIRYYEQNGSVELRQRLNRIKRVELLVRNPSIKLISCNLPAESYIIRGGHPNFSHYGHPYLSPLENWVKTGKVLRFLTALKVR
jgi:hypothetical protein